MLKQWKIGRKPDNDFVISTDPHVSRYHAVLSQISDNAYLLEDNGSTAGTYFEGVKIARALLTLPDSFTVSNTVLKVQDIVKPALKLAQVSEVNMEEEFLKLETIWSAYDKFQSFTIAATITITVAGSIIGGPGLGTLIGGTLARIGAMVLDRSEAKKLADVEFRAKYSCPNPRCRFHFSNTPFKDLRKRNSCPKCGLVFIHRN